MIDALLHAGVYSFDPAMRPTATTVLKDSVGPDDFFRGTEHCIPAAADAINAFHQESEKIIQSALERNDIVLRGSFKLEGVNIYDARCYRGFLTSTYFLIYREDEETKMTEGNFVIRMKDEKTIDTVYRWK